MGQAWAYTGGWVPLEVAYCQHLLTCPGPSQPQPQVKGGRLGSYLGEHKAVIVRVAGVLRLVAHGVEKKDSHDLRGAAA